MKTISFTFALYSVSALLPIAETAPTSKKDSSPANPSLRGSSELVGYSPTEVVANSPKPDIKYKLSQGQKENANVGGYLDFENVANPQPIRGSRGSDDPGPRMSSRSVSSAKTLVTHNIDMMFSGNYYYDRINSDKLAPPGTDHGSTINAQWPMGMLSLSIPVAGQ